MPELPIAILHLDESCLGNGQDRPSLGGAGALIEARAGRTLVRREVFISSPNTTNNKMALAGAIAGLQLLGRKQKRIRTLMVSDSEYLVRGMREWVPGWIARGWKRREGAVENLELWQALVASAQEHEVQFTWVRGHRGHPKNEYADSLAVRAAREQITSAGAVESGFDAWLEKQRAAGRYLDYDPDAAFAAVEQRLAAGERFALDAGV
jgi:ribonuclease HI